MVKDFGLLYNLFCLVPISPTPGGKIAYAVSPYIGVLGVVGGGAMVYMDMVSNPVFYLILSTGAMSSLWRVLGVGDRIGVAIAASILTALSKTESDKKKRDNLKIIVSSLESYSNSSTNSDSDINDNTKSSSYSHNKGCEDISFDNQVLLLLAYGSLVGALVTAMKWNNSRRMTPLHFRVEDQLREKGLRLKERKSGMVYDNAFVYDFDVILQKDEEDEEEEDNGHL